MRLSITISPTRSCSAPASSARDFALPCMTMRSAGKPAPSARCSSPPEATSHHSPSCANSSSTAVAGNALDANRTAKSSWRASAGRRGTRGRGRAGRPRRRRRRACRTRARARSRRSRRPRDGPARSGGCRSDTPATASWKWTSSRDYRGRAANGPPCDDGGVARGRVVTADPPDELGMRDGLAYALYVPPGEARGGIVILHGAGSCKESHYDYARHARTLGLAAVAFDLRGPRRERRRARRGRRGRHRLDRVAAARRRPFGAARVQPRRVPGAVRGELGRRSRRRGDLPGRGRGASSRGAPGALRRAHRCCRLRRVPARARRDGRGGRARPRRCCCSTPRATRWFRSSTRRRCSRPLGRARRSASSPSPAGTTDRCSTTTSCSPCRWRSWRGRSRGVGEGGAAAGDVRSIFVHQRERSNKHRRGSRSPRSATAGPAPPTPAASQPRTCIRVCHNQGMAPRRSNFGRDTGLQLRMLLTLFLLGLVYVVLIGVLFAVGASGVTILIIAGVLFVVQLTTSDKIALAAAGRARGLGRAGARAARDHRAAVRAGRPAQAARGDRRHAGAERLRDGPLTEVGDGVRDARSCSTSSSRPSSRACSRTRSRTSSTAT